MAFNVKKPAYKASTTTTTSAPAEKQEAAYSLKVAPPSDGKEKSPLEDVCLLWSAKDKKGNGFFKGTHKESKTKFFMMSTKKTASGWRLSSVDGSDTKSAFEAVCDLEEKKTKEGKTYYSGKDKDDQVWFVFPREKKG